MVKPSRLKVAPVAAAALAAPALLISACTPNEPAAPGPGPEPTVWTGSPAPAAPDVEPADTLSAALFSPDGVQVATATFEFGERYATVTVRTTGQGKLTPGFHGMHLHEVGKCEANSVAPTGGAPGDYLSAGGHFQAPGHHGHPQSGDLTALQVRSDGQGLVVTTTDAFTRAELLAGAGTSIIIHADDDNFAHIPADRYLQTNGTPGPDETTMKTGDAGQRMACGVIGAQR